MNRIKRARGTNSVMTGVFYLIAVFFFALLISFASYVIIKGFSGATPEMFRFLRKGSIGNQLFNTIYLVFISLVFSVPLGVTAGIYLSMYAKKGFLTKFLRICIETLSSLPSIVVGLFGYLVFLVFFGLGKSLLAGALSISILAIPVITTTTEAPTCPLNIFRPAETLSLQIWGLQINGQDPNLANLSAAVLMILVLLFSIGANALSRHINKKTSGESV